MIYFSVDNNFYSYIIHFINKQMRNSEMEERVVSAANRSPDGLVVMCVRHGCDLFYGVVDKIYPPEHEYWDWEQGFVTNKYRFVCRVA